MENWQQFHVRIALKYHVHATMIIMVINSHSWVKDDIGKRKHSIKEWYMHNLCEYHGLHYHIHQKVQMTVLYFLFFEREFCEWNSIWQSNKYSLFSSEIVNFLLSKVTTEAFHFDEESSTLIVTMHCKHLSGQLSENSTKLKQSIAQACLLTHNIIILLRIQPYPSYIINISCWHKFILVRSMIHCNYEFHSSVNSINYEDIYCWEYME